MAFKRSEFTELKKIDPEIMLGYKRWKMQRARCNNEKNRMYHRYGGRGIIVEYGPEEFCLWFKRELQDFKNNHPNENASVGRIDHDDNYKIGNIELVTTSENSKERIRRCGSPSKGMEKQVFVRKWTGKPVGIFKSISECSRYLKIPHPTLWCYLNGKRKNYTSYEFYFTNDWVSPVSSTKNRALYC